MELIVNDNIRLTPLEHTDSKEIYKLVNKNREELGVHRVSLGAAEKKSAHKGWRRGLGSHLKVWKEMGILCQMVVIRV